MKRASKIRKSPEASAPAKGESSPWASLNVITIARYGGVLLAILMVATFWKKSQRSVRDLTNADPEALKEAFFGKQPHLFYCSKGDKDEKIPGVFAEVHQYKGSTLGFAMLNCSQVLPSGKTILERFKLKKIVRPTIFATAPWMKPQQVALNHLKDYGTLIKYIDTAMAPKPTVVATDKELHKFCGFDRNFTYDARTIGETCVVVLRGARYGKVHTDLEKRLVLEYPFVHFAAVDAAKKRLSLEEAGEFIPADNFALKLHALRNGTHYKTMVNPATWDYLNTFVGQAVGAPLYDYSGDSEARVRLVKASADGRIDSTKPKVKKFKKRAPPLEKYSSGTPGGSTDQARQEQQVDQAAQEAAVEAERVRKERLRREEMERAAREHAVHTEDGEDGTDGDARGLDDAAADSDSVGGDGVWEDEEEDEDDSVIEL